MVTSNELATAAGITVPEWVDLTTDFDAQVRYLFPVLAEHWTGVSVMWPPTMSDGQGHFTAFLTEHVPNHPGGISCSVYRAGRATSPGPVVAKALGLYWGLTDADE